MCFREEFEGHKHFVKSSTYVGQLWDDPKTTVGLDTDEECEFAIFELTVENFPAFTCGVLLNQSSAEVPAQEPAAEAEPVAEEAAPEPAPETPEPEAAAEPAPEPEAKPESKPEPAAKTEPEPEPEPAPEPEPVAEAVDEVVEEVVEEPTPAEPETPQADTSVEETLAQEVEPETATKSEPEATPEPEPEPIAVEETPAPEPAPTPEPEPIAEAPAQPKPEPVPSPVPTPVPQPVAPKPTMAIPIPAPTGEALSALQLTARDILDNRMAWATAENSVEEVLNLMQQHDVGYAFVGDNGVLEGIVSKSDIMGALSPYLRPVFAKWRRPADDATLTIKVKWVMTRPVRTVSPEASVSVMMDQMCRFGGRCLPVVETNGQVLGMVTVFDLLRIINQAHGHTSMGRTPQAPCMQV